MSKCGYYAERANKMSPLCNLCTQSETPSGKKLKPKHYVKLKRVDRLPCDKIAEADEDMLRASINLFLSTKAPIPMALVMAYNERTMRD